MAEIKLVDGVYWKGGTTHCVEGAWNEWQAAGGGKIIQLGWHAYFIPPGAKPEDTVGNLGQEYDEKGRLITEQFYTPFTVKKAQECGKDITGDVISKYSSRRKK